MRARNRVENDLELAISSFFESIDSAAEFFVLQKHPSQTNKCTDDFNVHRDRTPTAEHTGKHGHALLGKCIRCIAPAAPRT